MESSVSSNAFAQQRAHGGEVGWRVGCQPIGRRQERTQVGRSQRHESDRTLRRSTYVVSSVNLFTVLDDPDVIDEALGEGGLAAMEEYVVLLRPHQDVEAEGGLGSLREGLDNLEADIAATRDGRIDERVGGYSATAVSAVLAAIGC